MSESLVLGVSETVIGFYRALDLREEPAENYFSQDGVWMRLGQVLKGHEAIRSALESRDVSRISCHLVSNLWARAVADGKAMSDYFVTVYEGVSDAPLRLVAILNAQDELVLVEGRWKISHKHSRRHLPAL